MTPETVGDAAHRTHDGRGRDETRGEDEVSALRAENAELRRRAEAVQRLIDELRAEAVVRRAEVRRLAEALPAAMSRQALVRSMLHDVRHHPDKIGVATRGVRKLGRGVRKVARKVDRGVRRLPRAQRKAMRIVRRISS